MEPELLKSLGQIAGIGGISLGVLLLVFREVIRKNVFPMLSRDQAYKILRLTMVLVWSIAVIGVGAWVINAHPPSEGPTTRLTSPQRDEIQYQLTMGRFFRASGRPEQAVLFYSNALGIDPLNKEANQAISFLEGRQ